MTAILHTQTIEDDEMKLRVWWIPQIPGKQFYVDVDTVKEGVKIMDVLAKYDSFQFDNNIKPDYANAGGLMMFDETDDTDGADGSWVDWEDEETGETDPRVWAEGWIECF